MNSKMKKFGKKIIFILLCVFLISIIGVYAINNKKSTIDEFQTNLELINDECNKVFSDIDGSEIKYLELLETEKDPFKIGLYSSALVQIYTYKQDYEKIVSYGENAIKSYKEVDGGAYYAIAEQKYLAWSMYNMGKYLDSFLCASDLLDLLNSEGKEILTKETFIDTESLIYSIFLRIYTNFDILDQAEIYYNKLCETSSSKNSKLDSAYIVEYSKLEYAIKINDVNLRKEYANNYYEIILELDIKSGNNVADSAILPLGTANIYLGEFEQALEQIQRAEKIYLNTNDSSNLASAYYSYAEYYKATGNLTLALEYYNKSIDLYYENEKYIELKLIIESTIDFIKVNNIDVDMYKYLSLDYIVSDKLEDDKTLNQLLSHIITINNQIGHSEIHFLEKTINRNIIIICFAIIVIILLIISVTKNIKTKNILEKLANKDFLTGLNNRSFGERLIQEKIDSNVNLSIGIIDIDNFKIINDNYGHIFGDYILKEVSRIIDLNIHKEDIIFRFGGEEFVIAFINKNKADSIEILDKIRVLVSEKVFDKNVQVTFSAGIIQLTDSTLNLALKDADALLYTAKHKGKNRIM